MTAACIGTPVSWLRLEQLALGQLVDRERDDVAAHLEACAACRACRDHVTSAPAAALRPLAVPPPRPRWRWMAVWTTGLAAAAAAALVLLLVGRERDPGELPGPRVAVKGGEIAIRLVRESGGATGLDPQVFVPGDRFKVRLTCPPGTRTAVISVHQGGQVYRPLANAAIGCGNDVAIPGAFALDGDQPVRVCARLAERPGAIDGPPVVCSEPIYAPSAP